MNATRSLVIVLVLGGFLAWFVLDRQEEAEPAGALDVSGAGVATVGEEPSGASPSAKGAEIATSPFAPPAPPPPLEADGGLGRGRVGPRLRVIEDTSGVRVPGAEVLVLGELAWSNTVTRRPRPPQRFVTDEVGELRLPPLVSGAWVEGRKGELFGTGRIALEDLESGQPAVLRLAPPAVVTVLVVDGAGAPQAGVPLRLDLPPTRWEVLHQTQRRKRTDAEGCARFAFPKSVVESEPEASPAMASIRPLIGHWKCAPVSFDLTKLPGGPLEVVLPPTSSLALHVEDPGGASHAGSLKARIAASRGQADYHVSEILEGDGPILRWPHVPAGLPLALHVQDAEGRYADLTAELPPLDAASGPHLHTLRFAEALPRLEAVLVDRSGEPFRGYPEVLLELRPRDLKERIEWPTQPRVVSTDAEGRLGLPLSRAITEPVGLTFSATLLGEGAPREATVDLPGPVLEDRDLGSLIPTEVPLLVAGRVIDSQGQPLPGSRITIMYGRSSVRGLRTLVDDGGGFFMIRSDAAGSFALYARAEGTFAIVVAHRGYATEECPDIEPGTRDAVLTLRRSAALEGPIILPEGAPAEQVRVLCHEIRTAKKPVLRRSCILGDRGLFRFEDLSPGHYTITVAVADGAPVATIAAIDLEAGQTLRHPRLDPLDLRTHVHLVTLRVHDQRGRPRGATARPVPPWPQPPPLGAFALAVTPTRGSSIDLLLSRLPFDISVSNQWHRELIVRVTAGTHDVTLAPALRMQVTVDLDGVTLPAGITLELSVSGGKSGMGYVPVPNQGAHVLTLMVPGPGRYQIDPELWKVAVDLGLAKGKAPRTVRLDALPFEVRDVEGEQEVKLTIPAAALRAGLERLQ